MTGPVVPRAFGVLLLVLTGALVANSAVGPLGLDVVDYPITGTVWNQLVGLELVTLVLVVPWCVIAGLRALRHRPDAAVLAFAPASYTLYMFVQYVLGPEYGDYRVVVLWQLAIVTLSAGLTLWSWSLMRDSALPEHSHRARRLFSAALFGLAGFVVLRYVGGIAGAFEGTPIPAEFDDARTFYWSIFVLDLGVVVPATVVAAVALRWGHGLGNRALLAVAGWFSLVPPSVAAMAAVMLVNDDPHGSTATMALLSVASVLFAGFAWAAYRPVLGAARAGSAVETSRREGIPSAP